MDSGAAGGVLPAGWCPQVELQRRSQRGKRYAASNGTAIKNKGSNIASAVTKEGQWKHLNFQVADVTKALASVSKMCDKDQSVVYHPPWHEHGSYIYNWNTGEYMNLLLQNGVYVLDAMIAPAQWQVKPSFRRPGR